jgi:hypothetical protein
MAFGRDPQTGRLPARGPRPNVSSIVRRRLLPQRVYADNRGDRARYRRTRSRAIPEARRPRASRAPQRSGARTTRKPSGSSNVNRARPSTGWREGPDRRRGAPQPPAPSHGRRGRAFTDLLPPARAWMKQGPFPPAGLCCPVPSGGTTTPSDSLVAACHFPASPVIGRHCFPNPAGSGPPRASPVPTTTFRPFHAPYAGGFLGTRSRLPGAVHGLRHRNTGSAPSWPLAR